MALLEREPERALLDEAAQRLASAGEGGAILLEGEAGIGKSSLLQGLVAAVRARGGATVLSARGTELESQLAFGAVRQLFVALVALPTAQRERLLVGPAALAAAVLGLRDMPHGALVDPLYALSWLVTNLAETAPLLIAIDDIHWLDAESGRFVAYLAQRLEGQPVLLAGTARPREPGAMASPLDVFRDLAMVVSPPPLSAAAVAEIVGDAAPSAEAHRLTGGNPFLLAELVRAIARAAPGTSVDELSSPAVAHSVSRRVRRIGADAVALSGAVSLFAAGAELAEAAEVAGLHRGPAAAAADALIDAQVMRVEGARLEYLHPLMRAAVYDALGPFARRQGHAAAAEALKRRGAPAEEIAAQLLAGEPAQSAENVAILCAAAERAIAAVAPRAAVRYLARAVEEGAANGAERRALLLDLGRWQRVTGDPGARDTLARACEESVGTGDHVRAAIELAATAYTHAENALVVQTVAATRGVEMSADEQLTLDMLHAEALWGEGRTEESMRLIEQVPPGLPGDTPAQRMALGMAGAARLIGGGATEEVLDMLRRSVGEDGTATGPVAGLDLGDPLQWFLQAGALDEAQALAEMRMDHARDSGDEALFAATQNSMGWLLQLRGDLPVSEAAFRLGLSNPAVSPFMRAHLVINLAETLINMGRIDAAETELETLPEDLFPWAATAAGVRRGEFARWRGDFAAALPCFEAEYRRSFIGGAPPHPNVAWFAPDYVDSLIGVGRSGEAATIAREFVARSERLGVDFGLGLHGAALARATGDLADHARAVDVLAASPYRWHEARARLEYGAALRRAGRRVQAREQLRLALDYCERNGVAHLAERARDELMVSGARLLTDAARSGAAALTPAEHRIAGLAAQGMSNKEIAQHLFVTVGTVQTTLVRVYRKLDIGGRMEIAAAMADQ
jgi:DNA-binding CsgD family transcriptional regulator